MGSLKLWQKLALGLGALVLVVVIFGSLAVPDETPTETPRELMTNAPGDNEQKAAAFSAAVAECDAHGGVYQIIEPTSSAGNTIVQCNDPTPDGLGRWGFPVLDK